MLIIRAEQMHALEVAKRAGFIERLVAHFTKVWPEKVQALGDGLRAFIGTGVDRALAYEITTEADIARFINLMFVWGKDFGVSPAWPWALEILHDPTLSGAVRVHQLAHRTRGELAPAPEVSLAKAATL
jgi:hypothetical protein